MYSLIHYIYIDVCVYNMYIYIYMCVRVCDIWASYGVPQENGGLEPLEK